MAAGFDGDGRPTGPALIEEDAAHSINGAAPGASSSDLILARPGRKALEASCDDRAERDAWLDAAFAALALCPPRSAPTKLMTYCMSEMRKWSAADMRIRMKM